MYIAILTVKFLPLYGLMSWQLMSEELILLRTRCPYWCVTNIEGIHLISHSEFFCYYILILPDVGMLQATLFIVHHSRECTMLQCWSAECLADNICD